MNQEHGILNGDYNRLRQQNGALSYRLVRRANEVVDALHRNRRKLFHHKTIYPLAASHVSQDSYHPRPYREPETLNILDAGAADGLGTAIMARRIKQQLSQNCRITALEISEELSPICSSNGQGLYSTVRGNIMNLPFGDHTFDILIMAAVIEHLPELSLALREARRVLRPGVSQGDRSSNNNKPGILIITSPHHIWEKLATMAGLLKDPGHVHVPTAKTLINQAAQADFELIEYHRFLLSPRYIPGVFALEALLGYTGLRGFLANQLFLFQTGSGYKSG